MKLVVIILTCFVFEIANAQYFSNTNLTVSSVEFASGKFKLQSSVGKFVGLSVLTMPKTQHISETNTCLESFKIYPNPASDYINISVSVNKLEITDTYGKKLICQMFAEPTIPHQIYIGNLKRGMYLLRVFYETNSKAVSFIKM